MDAVELVGVEPGVGPPSGDTTHAGREFEVARAGHGGRIEDAGRSESQRAHDGQRVAPLVDIVLVASEKLRRIEIVERVGVAGDDAGEGGPVSVERSDELVSGPESQLPRHHVDESRHHADVGLTASTLNDQALS